MLLAGDDDVAAGAVSFRYRDGEQRTAYRSTRPISEITRPSRTASRYDPGSPEGRGGRGFSG